MPLDDSAEHEEELEGKKRTAGPEYCVVGGLRTGAGLHHVHLARLMNNNDAS